MGRKDDKLLFLIMSPNSLSRNRKMEKKKEDIAMLILDDDVS